MVDGLAIVGPTASGKTELAIEVARRLGGEIISMDSRQVFRGMDIGTAKATPEQQRAVPHFGLDLLAPDERYSAGRFSSDARGWIGDISRRGNVPVVAGGTGFFLRSLTHPMFEEPPIDPARRETFKKYLDDFSRPELLRWLACLDEASARRWATEGGRHRLARAVEVALLTGRPLSAWHRENPSAERPLAFATFVLELPRDELYNRINRRVGQMLDAGFIEEVRNLMAAGYDESAPGMKTVGYTELMAHIRGQLTLDEAAEAIRRATRRYARRQETWFRHQLPPNTVALDATQAAPELVEQVKNAWLESVSV